ncbi:tetratricopeptide repeat protein [Actinoplanes sp. NPDC051470]|uniref:tetratricopeptide repeat protein n=1 Tax=unclassified Actinoplanes TaxID=2626549 RepID=UPI00343E6F3B
MSNIDNAMTAFRTGQSELAERWSLAELDRARADGDLPAEFDALCMLARVALRKRCLTDAWRLADKARTVAAHLPDRRHDRVPSHIEAVAARMSGNLTYARRLYREGIELSLAAGDARTVIAERNNLGYVELHAGDIDAARELFTQARVEALQVGNGHMLPDIALAAAVLSASDGHPERAAHLLGAAEAGYAALGMIPDPDDEDERSDLLISLDRTMTPDDLALARIAGSVAGIRRLLTDWA